MDKTLKKIDSYVKDVLAEGEGGAHAYDHTKRVFFLSLEIGERMDADLGVLGAAALLHDIGRPYEQETGISHSILSGDMGRKKLETVGYSAKEIDRIIDAIRTHRFSEGLKPNSLEGEILSDADKLDAVGAIGVFRAISQATETGVGIDGFLHHADNKLLKLKDLMYTDFAREIAYEKHQVLEEFVNQLRREVKDVQSILSGQ